MQETKRSKILVDPKIQWAIGRRVMLHWLLFAVCFGSVNILIRTILAIAEQPFAQSLSTAAQSQVPVLFVLAVMLPMFLLDTMKLTNRFAGPMFRLRHALRALPVNEKAAELTFRSGDFWPEVAVEFNAVAKQFEALRQRNAVLERELHALRQESDLQTV